MISRSLWVTRASCVMLLSVLSVYSSAAFSDWRDWWQTPEQRALKLLEEGSHEELINKAPDDGWKALGHFNQGNFEAASDAYSDNQKTLQDSSRTTEANTALYNQAVSDVMSGQYQQAIERFDSVLEVDPNHEDAEHNRDIAQQLLELEQQQQDQQQNSDSESGDSGEQSQSDEQSSEQGESSDQSDSGESGDQSDEQGEQSESEGQDGDSDDEQGDNQSASSSEEQRQQEEQAARDALAAEAQENQQNGDEQQGEQNLGVETEQPLTESEQATEQILRRIPDDPRGLLRRKLEQSHMNEFPEVRDARDPW